jgi:thioredoxin-like negative regulator of GroEL
MRSDVPERLVRACTRRVTELDDAERLVEEVAYFRDCWRRDLDGMMPDAEILRTVAHALDDLGLPDEAVHLQLRATAQLTRRGVDDPEALLMLARLYARTQRPTATLETLDYLLEQTIGRGWEGRAAMVRALAQDTLGQVDASRESYRAALRDPLVRDEAALRLALLDAREGACGGALPSLEAALLAEKAAVPISEIELALARCTLELGNPDRALQVALAVDEEPLAQDDARWIAGAASVARGDGPDDETLDALWAELLAEEKNADAFAEKIGDYRLNQR